MLPIVSSADHVDNFQLQTICSHAITCTLGQYREHRQPILTADVEWLHKLSEALEDLIVERAETAPDDYPGLMLEGPFVITDPDLLAPLARATMHLHRSNSTALHEHSGQLGPEDILALETEQGKLTEYLEYFHSLTTTSED